MRKATITFTLLALASLVLVACAVPAPAAGPGDEAAGDETVDILWWSHWAEETNKRDFIEQAIAGYEAANPNVDIEVVWWQKEEMFNALQNASIAGEGFPDIYYIDRTAPQIVDAGWAADLIEGINWDNIEGWAKESWTWPTGEVYAVALEASTLELYVNEGALAELGIEMPESGQFTAGEFMDVAKACKEAGLNVFAGGQQWWGSGALPFWYALEHTLGIEEFAAYFRGEVPVDTPEARAALEWAAELVALPAYGDSYSTNTIAEAHQDFHTKGNACFFPVGSWYTGRAFVPPDQGGQPDDFQLGCTPWPAMPDGAGNNEHLLYAAGSLAAHALSPNADTAIDILNFIAQEEYGNLWMAKTGVQTGIVTNLETMPENNFSDYFTMFADCKDDMTLTPINVFGQPPAFREAWVNVFNQGLPNGTMTLDEALATLEAARTAQ